MARPPENFGSAAVRHWEDAQRLVHQARLPAADHHTGIAAECAVKRAIVASGVTLKPPKGTGGTNFAKHMDVLWGIAPSAIDPAQFPQLHALLSSVSNPFDENTWKIDDRYAETGAIEADIAVLELGVPRWKIRHDMTANLLRLSGLTP